MGKTEDTSVNETQAVGAHKKSHKRRLRGFNLFSVIVFVAAMGFLGYKILDRKLIVQSGCSGQATSPIYDKAATLMTPQKLNELKNYTDEISKIKGHESDANCIYPVLYYHLSIGDIPGAKTEYEKLKNAYDVQIKLASVYNNAAATLTDVDSQMKRLDDTQTEFNRNRTFSE